MNSQSIQRGADERIRVTVDGTPDSEWPGLDAADYWWVLTADRDGTNIALQKAGTSADVSLITAGGGADSAVFTVDISDEETEALDLSSYYQFVVVRDGTGRISTALLDPGKILPEDTPVQELLESVST